MIQFIKNLSREPRAFAEAPAGSLLRYVFKCRQTLGTRGHTLFIAAVPKSASTFLLTSLSAITGYPIRQLCYGHERHEQDLYFPHLLDAYTQPTVTRHHTRATGPNLALMETFNIRPVIVVRNFFDVVPSILDYLYKEGFEKFPFLYCTERFAELDATTRLDCIIDMALPWYFSFYVSWFEAAATGKLDVLWIRYEDMVADWPATLKKILTFHGLERSEAKITPALAYTRGLGKDSVRFNNGTTGRGKHMLSADQCRRIRDMARFYPWVDFAPVGIDRP